MLISLHVCISFPITDTCNTNALIPSLTVSLLISSILTLIIGLLFDTLLGKYFLKSPKKNDVVLGPGPVYEEVQPPSGHDVVTTKANEAYGHM